MSLGSGQSCILSKTVRFLRADLGTDFSSSSQCFARDGYTEDALWSFVTRRLSLHLCLACSLRMEKGMLKSMRMGKPGSLLKFFFSSDTFLYPDFPSASSFSICIYLYVYNCNYPLHTRVCAHELTWLETKLKRGGSWLSPSACLPLSWRCQTPWWFWLLEVQLVLIPNDIV